MEPSILSLLPPVVAIGLAIATRRILLSLGIGIVLGALMYSNGISSPASRSSPKWRKA